MQKNLQGGAAINYGPSFPNSLNIFNGMMFYKTEKDSSFDIGLYRYALIEDSEASTFGKQMKWGWTPVITASMAGDYVQTSGDSMSGTLDMNFHNINNVGNSVEAGDGVTLGQMNSGDFLNLQPLAGYSDTERAIPVYTEFPFGQVTLNGNAVYGVDSTRRQVVFYQCSTPQNYRAVYMGWRHGGTNNFTFTSTPLRVAQQLASEYVAQVGSWGHGYVTIWLSDIASNNPTRVMLFDNNGASTDSGSWELVRTWTASELAAIAPGHTFALTTINSVRYVLHLAESTYVSSLRVSNAAGTLLRTLAVFNSVTDTDPTDWSGTGATSSNPHLAINTLTLNGSTGTKPAIYPGSGFVYSATQGRWLGLHSTLTLGTAGGLATGSQGGFWTNWAIPSSWIASGTGTPTNRIPLKAGGYRYRTWPDNTWNTVDGGTFGDWISVPVNPLNVGNAWSIASLSIDSEDFVRVVCRDLWAPIIGRLVDLPVRINNVPLTPLPSMWTPGNAAQVTTMTVLQTPAINPWARQLLGYGSVILGDTILLHGGSPDATAENYSPATIAKFDPSNFGTTFTTGDSLIINPSFQVGFLSTIPVALRSIMAADPYTSYGEFTTIALADESSIQAFVRPGLPVWTVSSNGNGWVYSNTGLTAPSIPASLGVISKKLAVPTEVPGFLFEGIMTWNGSTTDPEYLAIIQTPTNTNSVTLVSWKSGVWTTVATNLFQTLITASQTGVGNRIFLNLIRANHVFAVGSGNWYNESQIYFGTGAEHFGARINKTGTGSYKDITAMAVNGAGASSHGPDAMGMQTTYRSFGYTPSFGLFFNTPLDSQKAIVLQTQKKPGNAVIYTESSWWDSKPSRHQIWIATTPSVGLTAYVPEYPIFIGGYFRTMPTTTLTLQPNATQYLVVEAVAGSRNLVNIFVSQTQVADSFSRYCFAKLVTNATGIVNSDYYYAFNRAVNRMAGSRLTTALTIGEQTNSPDEVGSRITHRRTDGTIRWTCRMSEADVQGTTLFWEAHDTNGAWLKRVLTYSLGGVNVDGNVTATGPVTGSSDRRLKKNVERIDNPLGKLNGIHGYTYTRKSNGNREVGVIAQEVEKVLPEVVFQHPGDEYKSVAYGNLVALIIETIRTLKAELSNLEAEYQKRKAAKAKRK